MGEGKGRSALGASHPCGTYYLGGIYNLCYYLLVM
jgi:hypothetical protein